MGLNMGHAYSLLDVRTVTCKVKGRATEVKLLKLRNPWGHGMSTLCVCPVSCVRPNPSTEGSLSLSVPYQSSPYTSAIDVASDCVCDPDCDCCNCIGPAGAGEWTGPWGDQSEEFTENCEAIAAAFKTDNAAEVVEARDDGTFFMDFEVSAGWGIGFVYD